MKSYTQIYLNYFDLGLQDEIFCEGCMRGGRVDGEGFDLHHVNGRIGKDADKINNIMLLCRKCHTRVHEGKVTKADLQYIHNNVLQGNRKQFLK
jgi:5-methylcytosine-specific restriction endonuclease McrA